MDAAPHVTATSLASTTGDHPDGIWTGTLHVFVAFDWGDDMDLDQARQLVPAEVQDLNRRRPTPTSIDNRTPP